MGMDARKVYDEAIVIDGLSISNWESDAVFERLRAGNITAINATVATWENFQQTMAHLAGWMRRFRERQDILQVKETADIHTAKKLGKTGIILGFQNASPIENELDRLGLFLALGVRVIQLTYHETNLLGSGCWERFDSGLSNSGWMRWREMNRLGIVIDLSTWARKPPWTPSKCPSSRSSSPTPTPAVSAATRATRKKKRSSCWPKRGVSSAPPHTPPSFQEIRFDGGGFRGCPRQHGGADRPGPRGYRHRFHPRSAAGVLALHRLPAGHQVSPRPLPTAPCPTPS